jgi:hypothetical protein
VLEAIFVDSQITVPVEVFEQKLKLKYPQRASEMGDRLVAAFVQDNPQYRVTYDGVKAVSVSWPRTGVSAPATMTPATASTTPALEEKTAELEQQFDQEMPLAAPDRTQELATGQTTVAVAPPISTINRRKRPRVPCRKTKAYVITDQVAGVVVEVIDISRGGLCFASFEQFRIKTAVSIATHYMEGGQNIFQDGLIIRVRHKESGMPAEYAVEFSGA